MKTKSSIRQFTVYLGLCAVCSAISFYAGRYSTSPSGSSVATPVVKNKTSATRAPVGDMTSMLAHFGITMASLLHSPGAPDADKLALWAASLSPQDCAAALASLQTMPVGVQRDALLKAVVDAWAKHDPAGFLAATNNMNNPRLRETGAAEALRALAAQDPQSALAWLKQNPGDGSAAIDEARFNATIAGYASTDPTDAFNYVNAMSDTNKQDTKLKKDAFTAIADGMAQQGRFSDAMALFSQLPDGSLRNDAFNSVIDRWGAAAPQDAAAWIATNAPPSAVNDYNESLVGAWVNSDPAAAAIYAVQAESQLQAQGALGGPNNTDTLPNTISAWAKYDLNAAGQFINQLPASPVKDRALSTFISTASKVDPAGTMAWASAASDPQTAQKFMIQVAKQWQQSDPAAYNQFLATTTTLTPDQVQTLVNLPTSAANNKKNSNNQN